MRADISAWKENETTAILRVFNEVFYITPVSEKGWM